MKLEHRIFYDTNMVFGNVDSLSDLVKICAVQLNSPSDINTVDDFLDKSMQDVAGSKSFGTRREHKGTTSLRQYLLEIYEPGMFTYGIKSINLVEAFKNLYANKEIPTPEELEKFTDLRGDVIKPGHTVVVANKNSKGPVMRIGTVVELVKKYDKQHRPGELFVKVKYGPKSVGGTEHFKSRIVILNNISRWQVMRASFKKLICSLIGHKASACTFN